MAVPTKRKTTDVTVWQKNALIDAIYSMNLEQKRVFWMLLTRIRKDSDGQDLAFTLDEYRSIFNDSENVPAEIRHGMKKLLRMGPITYVETLENGDKKEREILLFSDTETIQRRGMYAASFNTKIMPLLRGIDNDFTLVNLHEVSTVRNPFALRLFEFLMRYRDTGYWLVSVDDVVKRFKLSKAYQTFGNLNNKYIKPAVEELNRETPYTIEVMPLKKKGSRKVLSIRFDVRRKAKPKVIERPEHGHMPPDKVLSMVLATECVDNHRLTMDELMDLRYKLNKRDEYDFTAINTAGNELFNYEMTNEVIEKIKKMIRSAKD